MKRMLSFLTLPTMLFWGCQAKLQVPTAESEAGSKNADGRNYAEDLQRQKTLATLRAIGIAYQACLTTAPPRDENELKSFMEGAAKQLLSARDQKPLVICYGVDPGQLPDGASNTLLAWEATADSQGGRCVLYADGRAAYLPQADFEAAKKASSAHRRRE